MENISSLAAIDPRTGAIPTWARIGHCPCRTVRIPGHVTWKFRPMPCSLNNQTVWGSG
jgi:hypothetical protein